MRQVPSLRGPHSLIRFPGYVALEALHVDPDRRSGTRAQGCVFVAEDGESYWLKHANVGGHVQGKLAAELVAGRVGAKLGVAPPVAVIHVSEAAVGINGEGREFVGTAFGSRAIPDTENSKTFGGFAVPLGAENIDGFQRARTVAFQTLIGQRDQQLLVRVTDGFLYSIDHEEWDAFDGTGDMRLVVTPVSGLSESVGRSPEEVEAAVQRVESLSDGDLIDAVSCLPSGDGWCDAEHLLRVAHVLSERRDRLGEVMRRWIQP